MRYKNKRIIRLIITIFGVILAEIFIINVLAAAAPRLVIDGEYLAPSGLSEPRVGIDETRVRFTVSTLSMSLLFPNLWRKDLILFVTGPLYRRYTFDFENWSPSLGDRPPEDLHALRYLFFLAQPLINGQSFHFFLLPELSSDFKQVRWNHARIDGGLQFNVPFERSRLGVGMVYTTNFGKPRLLPLLSWRWNGVEQWRTQVTVPAAAEAWYAFSSTVEGGLILRFSGDQFRIGAPGPFQDRVVRFSSGKFGPALRLNLARSVALRLDGGVAFRRYGVFDGDDEFRSFNARGGGFIQLQFSFPEGSHPTHPDDEPDFLP